MKSLQPKINIDLTVVIPIYNRAEMLAQALHSLRWQTYKDFCVIICDNASQENIQEVVKNFRDLKIEYHRYEIHTGPVQNFIRAAKLCQTPFMKILCSDDLLFPTVLAKQVKALQEVPNAAICLGGSLQFRELQAQRAVSLFHYLPPYIPRARTKKQWAQIEKSTSIDPSSCMYRTELFYEVGGLNPGLQTIDDLEIFLALSYKYPVVAVHEPVSGARLHAEQTITKSGLDSESLGIKDIFWMTSKANPFSARIGLPSAQQTFLRQNICWQELRIALASERKLFLLKKWLKMMLSNQMLITFFLGFPLFAIIKILRKPKTRVDPSNIQNPEKYEAAISSILFNEHSNYNLVGITHDSNL